jgi:hypothetical protein
MTNTFVPQLLLAGFCTWLGSGFGFAVEITLGARYLNVKLPSSGMSPSESKEYVTV